MKTLLVVSTLLALTVREVYSMRGWFMPTTKVVPQIYASVLFIG